MRFPSINLAWLPICILAGLLSTTLLGQNVTLVQDSVGEDSIVHRRMIGHRTVIITPYFERVTPTSLGSFAVLEKDTLAVQSYAGSSILNTLRGHVPGLFLGSDFSGITGGMRGGSPMIVIDGIQFTSAIRNYFNLNAFEYESIYSLSSGNGASVYGRMAEGGAIFLESKTGKNQILPSLEFNVSPAIQWGDVNASPNPFSISLQTIRQWTFTNGLAYARDFGKIDTRVSYNFNITPGNNIRPDNKSGFHYLKVNTGADISKKFSARFIIDGLYTKNFYVSNSEFAGQQSFERGNDKNIQANLILKYDVLNWLAISSQSAISRIGNSSEQSTNNGSFNRNDDESRDLMNLFVSARKSLGTKTVLKAFTGTQLESTKSENSRLSTVLNPYSASGYASILKHQSAALSGGIGIEHNNFLFADVNYRSEKVSSIGNAERLPNYAITSAFIFSEAFKWKGRIFSFGKFRGSYGKSNVLSTGTFPEHPENSGEWNVAPYPSLITPIDKTMMEMGLDVSFFRDKLGVSLSRFEDVNDKTFIRMPLPILGNQRFYTDLGESRRQGWEVILSGKALSKRIVSMTTKVIWSNMDLSINSNNNLGRNIITVGRQTLEDRRHSIDVDYWSPDDDTSTEETPSGNNTPRDYQTIGTWIIDGITPSDNYNSTDNAASAPSVVLPSLEPDWYATVLNQLAVENCFITFLLFMQKGGTIISPASNGYNLNWSDATYVKLQDVSAGYVFPETSIKKLGMRHAQISIFARNMWTIYAASGTSAEPPSMKIAGLSISGLF